MDEGCFSLQELSDASGIEPRTIRSYIEKGLLPGPESLGRHASYGDEHLARLKVIGLLRDARREITLDQIRGLLAQLSPEQIDHLAASRLKIGELLDNEPAATTALDYLRGIGAPSPQTGPRSAPQTGPRSAPQTGPRSGPRSAPQTAPLAAPRASLQASSLPPSGARPESNAHSRTPVHGLLESLASIVGSQNVPRSVRGEAWHRIQITPDIELSVRGHFASDQIAQLHRIGDHLRILLTKGART